MKIEIGESLALSYLKHVKKCVLYQNNWKISSKWAKSDNDMAGDIFYKIKHIKEYIKKKELENKIEKNAIEVFDKIFPNKELKKKIALCQKLQQTVKDTTNPILQQTEIDTIKNTLEKAEIDALNQILKKNKIKTIDNILKQAEADAINQILKQAEIDALGIDKEGKMYTMDIAFHEGGLNYRSNKEETARRIIEKLLSSYMMLLRYFPNRNYEIIFASPKVGEETEKSIIPKFDGLKKLFSNEKVEFKYISNEAFSKEILKETIDNSKEDSDTNELFMRSYKLIQLLEDISNKKNKKINLNKKNSPTDYIELEFKQKNLEFEFIPSDEKQFKKELIKTKQAKITWFYPDRQEETVWNADKISENSKIRENIRNRKKVKAREKSGLYKVKLEII
jgi:hypothetical protein